jgi:hypothetical protein
MNVFEGSKMCLLAMLAASPGGAHRSSPHPGDLLRMKISHIVYVFRDENIRILTRERRGKLGTGDNGVHQ